MATRFGTLDNVGTPRISARSEGAELVSGVTLRGYRFERGELPSQLTAVVRAVHRRDRNANPDTRCCVTCPGWAVFETNRNPREIERCDECARFETDEAAVTHVVGLLRTAANIIERIG